MVTTSQISHALSHGVEFLSSQQLQTGGFSSLAAASATDFSENIRYQTVFSTALILQNLAQLTPNIETDRIKQHLVRFLLTQKSPHWSWNYWDRASQEALQHPYPDDLDDTFCALTALQLARPDLITGEVLAQSVQQLTALEVAEGGPYTTWLVGRDAKDHWRDVDLGVNLNIGYFLHLNGVALPNLTEYFVSALATGKITSPYYPKQLPLLYLASRFLHSKTQKQLLLSALAQATPQNSLEDALCLLSWINLGETGPKLFGLATKLSKAQQSDGSWPAAGFYTGVNPARTKKYFAGSAPLTTSYVLLALHTMMEREKPKLPKPPTTNEALRQKILEKMEKRFAQLSPEPCIIAKQYLAQVELNDHSGGITMLPWVFCQAIGERAAAVSEHALLELGAASAYGWIAYTIYDDFLDAEARRETLPLANCCLRELTVIFTNLLPQESGFAEFFQQILDLQESANTWEVTHCRFNPDTSREQAPLPQFGDHSRLAHRSLGHCLGCCAILTQLGFTKDSATYKKLQLFFHHYLIARQFNDDAHDWEADLSRGHITAVGAQLIHESLEQRRKIFWTKTVDWVCQKIQENLTAAETALSNLPLEHPELLKNLLTKPAEAITRVQLERKKVQEFFQHY